MHRRIPIFSAYPVFLSATTVQQVACEAHSDDSGATTAAVPIRSEPEVIFHFESGKQMSHSHFRHIMAMKTRITSREEQL